MNQVMQLVSLILLLDCLWKVMRCWLVMITIVQRLKPTSSLMLLILFRKMGSLTRLRMRQVFLCWFRSFIVLMLFVRLVGRESLGQGCIIRNMLSVLWNERILRLSSTHGHRNIFLGLILMQSLWKNGKLLYQAC